MTNDFRTVSSGGAAKSKALNMVIKLANIDGKPCVKISDELTKVRRDVKLGNGTDFASCAEYW